MSAKITVIAKITAGTHPVHGPIVEGEHYEILEHQFASELFAPPKGWLAPWERPVENHNASPAAAGKKRR